MSKEEMLKKVLDDPATRDIADSLGVDIQEYAEQVVFFMANPQAEPKLQLMDPAVERAKGIPSPEELAAKLQTMIAAADVRSEKSVYEGIESDDPLASGSLKRRLEDPPLPKKI
jgi:hypothetical protein